MVPGPDATVPASECNDAPVVTDSPRIPPAWSLPADAPLEVDAASGKRAAAAQTAAPETYTDDTGHYRFAGLPHGTHKVTLDPDTLPPHLRPAPPLFPPHWGGTKGGRKPWTCFGSPRGWSRSLNRSSPASALLPLTTARAATSAAWSSWTGMATGGPAPTSLASLASAFWTPPCINTRSYGKLGEASFEHRFDHHMLG
jgi:hypothetical protein